MLSLDVVTPENTSMKFNAVIHMQESPPQAFLGRMQLALHATRPAQRLTALRACYKQYLPGR